MIAPNRIIEVVQTIQRGGIIAYPTEGVWGLGCDPWNQDAVQRIFFLKKRALDKGFIMVASHIDQIHPIYSRLNTSEKNKIAGQHTQENITWVVPDPDHWIPPYVKGRYKSIAIRISQHPVVMQICDKMRSPIISTSANVSGLPALTTYEQVVELFYGKVDMVVQGSLGGQRGPSTIKNIATGERLR